MLPAACHSYFETSPLDPTTISMLDELPLACYCALWCGCCCYCDAGPHTRVCVLIRDGFLLNAITSFTVCVRLADLWRSRHQQRTAKRKKKPHTTFSFCWCSPAIFFRFFLFFYSSIFPIPTGCSMSSGKRNVFDLLYIALPWPPPPASIQERFDIKQSNTHPVIRVWWLATVSLSTEQDYSLNIHKKIAWHTITLKNCQRSIRANGPDSTQ